MILVPQDKNPKHTAKIIKKWFEDNKINVLPWPLQSPDLNPTEHLGSEVERRISNRMPTNKGELKDITQETWTDIHNDGTYIMELVDCRCLKSLRRTNKILIT